MERSKDIKVVEVKKTGERGDYHFTLEQVDEMTHKLHVAIATLEILDIASSSPLEIEPDYLSALVSEAKDRLIETRDILNPEMDKGTIQKGGAT
jgi:hypothetical protein